MALSIHQPAGSGHPWEYLEFRDDLTVEQQYKRRQDWCQMAYAEGRNWLKGSEEAQEMTRYISYLMGKQWTQRRPSYKASPVNNRMLRSMEETVAILTDIRPTYEVKALNEAYNEAGKLLTNTTKAWWVNQDVDFQLAMSVIYAYLSTGYLRIVWNKHLMNGLGDFQATPLGIDSIMPIGPAFHNLQDWEGLIYESVRPLSFFRQYYPHSGYKVKATQALSQYALPRSLPRGVSQATWNNLSESARRILGSPQQFSESVVAQAPYREFWVRDYSLNTSKNEMQIGDPRYNWSYKVQSGERIYPRGRLIITGGDECECMYDGPNFFWHGRWPYIPVRLKPVPWQFHGISEMRTKMPMQDVINHILAGVLDMVKKAINPALIYPENAFSNAVQQQLDPSMPGAKIAYSQQAIAAPAYSKPPELPQWVYNTLQYMQNEMDDDSGLLDLPGLGRKKITPAGDTLEELKEGQQTIMRYRGRNMEITVREVGEQMIWNFPQFYTLKRRMYMFGAAGVTHQDVFDWKPETMVPAGQSPEDFVRNFAFTLPNGSILNINRTEQTLLVMALRRQGDFSRKSMFEQLDMGQIYEKVQAELKQEAADQLAEMAKAQLGAAVGGKGSINPQNLLSQR